MKQVRFSRLAAADLLGIAAYTVKTWGQSQTDRYLNELEDFCRKLARSPGIGRACDQIRLGICRSEHGRHVIFFRREAAGITVLRILYERMLPEGHLFDEG